MHLLFGIDTLLQQSANYIDHRIGLVTNNAATTADGRQSRVAMLQNGFNIIKLFSPEHGLNAVGADGSFQQHTVDPLTGLPVMSLYGTYLQPTHNDLADIDLLIFDLPDVGCRFYTYQWTLSYMMESCAAMHKPLIVCDRPNPISGHFSLAEGPMLDTDCTSFIGRWNIPLRHSCTIGELAQYWNHQQRLQVALTIMQVQNWQRQQLYTDLNIPFVPTSPGIPDAETALLYPGTGLLEGINVNEGRGTETPFKILGAPWIDAQQLHHAFSQLQLAGVQASPIHYTPTWGRYAHQNCNGIQLAVTDARHCRSVTIGLWLLHLLLQLYPQHAAPALYPTNANPSGGGHLEKLTGYQEVWSLLQLKTEDFTYAVPKITSIADWQQQMQPYLLYQ